MAQPKDTLILIAGNKIDDIKVRSRDGDAIGHVYTLMTHKRTGQATHAVLSLGGFLGLNKSYYPLPFKLLDYDAGDDSYRVTIDRRLLEGGPSWSNNPPVFDQAYADRVANYYGVPSENLSL